MQAVRVWCEDEMDRVRYIPVSQIQVVELNADGDDKILTVGGWHTCYNGVFVITELWSNT